MSAPSSAIKYMWWWCSVFSSKGEEQEEEGEAEGGEEEEEGAMCQSLSSGDTWPLLLSLGWRRHCPRCCGGGGGGGGGDVLACCCGGGHKLRGRDVIEKHNWRKKKEGGLHCTAPFSFPPPSPLAALRVFFLLLFLLLSRLFGHIFSRLLSLKYVPHKRALHFSLKCGNL